MAPKPPLRQVRASRIGGNSCRLMSSSAWDSQPRDRRRGWRHSSTMLRRRLTEIRRWRTARSEARIKQKPNKWCGGRSHGCRYIAYARRGDYQHRYSALCFRRVCKVYAMCFRMSLAYRQHCLLALGCNRRLGHLLLNCRALNRVVSQIWIVPMIKVDQSAAEYDKGCIEVLCYVSSQVVMKCRLLVLIAAATRSLASAAASTLILSRGDQDISSPFAMSWLDCQVAKFVHPAAGQHLVTPSTCTISLVVEVPPLTHCRLKSSSATLVRERSRERGSWTRDW